VTRGAWTPRHRIPLISAVLLGGLVVVLATHQDQARAIWKSVTGMPPTSLAVVLLLALCQLGFQAVRLWTILPRDVAVTLARTAYAFALGEWCNIFTPARGGDALKVVLLNRTPGPTRPSLPKATGVVLADKIVDAGSLVLICTATGMAGLLRTGAETRLPYLRIVVLAGAVVTVVLLGLRWTRPRWLAQLARVRRELAKGFGALRDPVKLLASIGFSLGAWLAELLALRVLCAGQAFPLSLAQVVLALAALNLGIIVPVSIANLGVYEAALAFGLSRSGMPLPTAVAIATTHHALQLLGTNLGAGALSLWVAGQRRSGHVPDAIPGEG
jgi:glycosyltransferase 2 family protein